MPVSARASSLSRRRPSPQKTRRPRLEVLEAQTLLAVITVTSSDDLVNDGSQVTLRAAIESIDAGADVNSAVTAHRIGPYLGGNTSPDEIDFDIPGSGVQTIVLNSPLPAISVPVIIDGYTQPGASPNTNPIGEGLNAVPLVEIDAAYAGYLPSGVLGLAAGDSTVRGLVINQAPGGPGIELDGSGGNLIAGDFIGTDASGTLVFPPDLTGAGGGGIELTASDNTIGGTAPADRNLISGSGGPGIEIVGPSGNNVVEGDLIGTDITGTKPLGNAQNGVDVFSTSGSTLGGSAAGAANVISGNQVGVELDGPDLVQGNLIGTDPSGTLNVGNAWGGVEVSGSGAQIIGNTIAYNGAGAAGGGVGVDVDTGNMNGNGNLVSQNSIFSNSGIGIELGEEGQIPVQPVPTAGPNDSQNYPILSSVTAMGDGTEIQGTLSSVPNHTFRLEFFANAARDPTTFSDALAVLPGEFSEGQTYIGSLNVTTDATGNVAFPANLPALPASEPFITATATDITNTGNGPANNTSEFSPVMPLGGPSFVVTNTGDKGIGTLREAIYSAEDTPGSHTITFDISPTDPRHFYYTNAGVPGQVSQSDIATTTAPNDSSISNINPAWPHSWYSIEPTSPLPPLFDIDSINGYSQPGSSQNTLSPLQQGLNTVLRIEIDGQDVMGDGLLLEPNFSTVHTGTSTIAGLAINRFHGNGINVYNSSGDTIAGNFIGTDVSGTLALGNGSGIGIDQASNITIGGSTSGAANLIAGNRGGISIGYDYEAAGIVVDSDLIGAGRNISPALPNAGGAVGIETVNVSTNGDQSSEEIRPGEEFVDCGLAYAEVGILLDYTAPSMNPTIGAAILGGWAEPAVFLMPKSQFDSPTAAAAPGPAFELTRGANPLTNPPMLTTATTASSTTATGRLSSQPDETYLIQFYSNTQLLPAGYGPGDQYVGSADVTTNSAGDGSFMFQSETPVAVGRFITATATLLNSSGSPLQTSEFSQGIVVQQMQLLVANVTTTDLLKGRVDEGTSTVNVVFNQAVAPLADSTSFYSLVTPKRVRVNKKVTTQMVPVASTARLTAANTVTLKLTKPSKLPLTLTVKSGDPAAHGQTLAKDVAFTV